MVRSLILILWNVVALQAAIHWRLCPAERPDAWAAPAPVTALLAAVAIAATAVLWRRHADRRARRDLAVAVVWPAVPLAIAWLVLPAAGAPSAPALVVLGLVAVAGWRLAQRRDTAARRGPWEGKLWRGFHGIAVVAAIAGGLLGGGFGDAGALALSLMLYPLYALAQLYFVLAVPWPRLRRLAGGDTRPAIISATVVFALIHWPNPALMILTAAGMACWAREYARGRGLVPLALSMGLLATLAAQGLPDAWTDHMRVGPGAVRQRAVPRLADAANARTHEEPAGRARATAFIADLYPGITGRAATRVELDRWWLSVAACRRGVLAWRFYISPEYRRKHDAALPGDVHWTDLPDPWPARIGAFTDASAGGWDGHLARLYREILDRDASPDEIAAWSPALSPRQRRRIVEVLLERRRSLARAPFDTLGCAAMKLHH